MLELDVEGLNVLCQLFSCDRNTLDILFILLVYVDVDFESITGNSYNDIHNVIYV